MLFSLGVDEEQKLSNSDALYRAFVAIQEGQLTNEDYLASSLDMGVLRLFLWKCRQNQETESEERSYQLTPLERLAEIVRISC